MATRCIIGKKEKDGAVKCIHCNFDGYLDGVGRLLNDYYKRPERGFGCDVKVVWCG